MRWKKTVTMIEAHAEGEVGRIVTGGVIDVPGQTMLDKMNYINQVDDSLRRFLVFEPRGCAQMSTNLIFPPTHPDADVGFLILQGDKAHAMSGSNSICLVTVLLETGMIEMLEHKGCAFLYDTEQSFTASKRAWADKNAYGFDNEAMDAARIAHDIPIVADTFRYGVLSHKWSMVRGALNVLWFVSRSRRSDASVTLRVSGMTSP